MTERIMADPDRFPTVEPDDRRAKKIREVDRLRGVPASRTIEMGFGLMMFARRLREAAEHERPDEDRRTVR